MTPVISFTGVSFEFPNGRELFSGLSFSLPPRLTALVGPNGAGKTTLARLLHGELRPTAGRITKVQTVTLFAQRVPPPTMTVNQFLGADYVWDPLSENLLAGIDREQVCTDLSGGQWMRVRLARLPADGFLILDEPTNDLDREGRRALLDFLKRRRGGMLLISHDRECLRLCDDILELSNQGLAKFGGGWDEYLQMRQAERDGLSHALEKAKQQRDRAAQQRAEQRSRQDKRNRAGVLAARKGGMPKILMGARKRRAQATTGMVDAGTHARAESAVHQAHQKLSELKLDPVMHARLFGQPLPAQKLIAEARGFNAGYGTWIYPGDLNFAWRGPLRMALKGGNGAGKSTLLQAVLGRELPRTRGELRRGGLRALYLDQRCGLLDDAQSVLENARNSAALSEDELRAGLARFLFTGDLVFQIAGQLSGGERLRAALAKGFLTYDKPELLVLDEPTNNLDLVNVQFLENLVREFKGALLIVSHDEVFLKNCQVEHEFHLDEG